MQQDRRVFLRTSGLALLGITASELPDGGIAAQSPEPIIDVHQHVHYHGRADDVLLTHQRTMGITTTILLPAGRSAKRPSTHDGVANGLQAQAYGNDACYQFATAHRDEIRFGANEVPDIEGAIDEITRYLDRGAVVIGEQKFGVACDAPEMQRIYQLAQERGVPVLMHWQFRMYNHGFERFYRMLEKYPKVNFIGHAQTWWANIDKHHTDQTVLYPKTPVTRGGLTDRYLTDYENMFGDLSAGSGHGALARDEEFARDFITRHQNKLLYGSDCSDHVGRGEKCSGATTLAIVRRLASSKAVERKLLYDNAKNLFRL